AATLIAGSWFSTVIASEASASAASLSTTRRRRVAGPRVGRLAVAVAAVPSSNAPSSSRSHAYDAMLPSGSSASAVNVTGSELNGVLVDAEMEAGGGALATENTS